MALAVRGLEAGAGRVCRMLLMAALWLAALPAGAWDAGPSQCAHDVCSGGVISKEVLDTQPKYADSVFPGRLADCPAGYHNIGGAGCGRTADSIPARSVPATCPDGFTNMGLTCYRGPEVYHKPAGEPCRPGFSSELHIFCSRGAESLGGSSMSCPAGYFRSKVDDRCQLNCPAGYTNTGETCFRGTSVLGPTSFSCHADERRGEGLVANKCFPVPGPCTADREEYGVHGASLCFRKCPAGSHRTAISTCAWDVKFRGNTHLFVARGAVEVLRRYQQQLALRQEKDPVADMAVQAMTRPACQQNWEQGLQDADNLATLAEGSRDLENSPNGSHFYTTGLDYTGKPTTIRTYVIGTTEQYHHLGDARTQARIRVANAGTFRGNPGTEAQAAVKDSSGAATDACTQIGLALHYLTDMTQPMHASTFSAAQVPLMLHPVLEEYVPTFQAEFPPEAAWDMRWKDQSPDAVFQETARRAGGFAPQLMKTLEYRGTVCSMNPETGVLYTGTCFLGDADVKAGVGFLLRDAYQSTASFIYAVFRDSLR